MLPYPPWKTTYFFSQVRPSTTWCCSDTPIAFQSAPEACWPQALGYIPLNWDLLFQLRIAAILLRGSDFAIQNCIDERKPVRCRALLDLAA